MIKIWKVRFGEEYRLDANTIDYEVVADNPEQAIKRARRIARRIANRDYNSWAPRWPILVKLLTTTTE